LALAKIVWLKPIVFIYNLLNGLKPNPIEFSYVGEYYLLVFCAKISWITEEKGSFYHN